MSWSTVVGLGAIVTFTVIVSWVWYTICRHARLKQIERLIEDTMYAIDKASQTGDAINIKRLRDDLHWLYQQQDKLQ